MGRESLLASNHKILVEQEARIFLHRMLGNFFSIPIATHPWNRLTYFPEEYRENSLQVIVMRASSISYKIREIKIQNF
jgi:hypothetical protein